MKTSKEMISALNRIENEYPEFFGSAQKEIADYVTSGIFMSSGFVNPDLPPDILQKVRTTFDEFELVSLP